jgi:2-polyprenyl-3-methyl-5-hydroxy-6-metoxy-1,4-benzoquinol methylase
MKMDNIQNIQENQYEFPYHYLPSLNPVFRFAPRWSWALKYMATTKFLVNLVKSQKGKLLDVGCGDGRLISEIKKNDSNLELYGVDYSEQAILLASAFTKNAIFNTDESSLINKSFEFVLCIEVLEHIPIENVEVFIENLISKIGKSGKLILTVPHKNVKVQKKHYQHFDQKKLQNLFGDKLEIEQWYYIDIKSKFFELLMRFFSNNLK